MSAIAELSTVEGMFLGTAVLIVVWAIVEYWDNDGNGGGGMGGMM